MYNNVHDKCFFNFFITRSRNAAVMCCKGDPDARGIDKDTLFTQKKKII